MSDHDAAPDYFRDWRAIRALTDPSVFAAAGYGGRPELGLRPALLVIDSTYRFAGVRGVSQATSMETYPLSSGPSAWSALTVIRKLIVRFRKLGLPVIYSAAPLEKTAPLSGLWARKSATSLTELPRGNEIVDEIAPGTRETIIRKTKPSVFHGTPLLDLLIGAGIDSLVMTGGTTSGCVRASAVDAFSLNYPVFVVEDGVFDRAALSHAVSLFDLDQKYAEVLSSEALEERLRGRATA
ncbi:MAG: isochorismatase family protein [Acidimicrobiia bacterium]|nr:isochorismatase family protein [Acidimicrobiia bacterium]